MEPENKQRDLHQPEEQQDADDPALDAWLLAREEDLEEMAWATLDQFDDRSGQ